MDIGIFIEYDNRVVQIPVNPKTFKVDTAGNNDTAEIISLGEIVIPRKKKLSGISWDSFFPYESWHPAIRTKGDFKSAAFYLNFLDTIREDRRPCHLTVTGIGFDDEVVIESFDYHHQAGDHEDTYYTITFKQYQPYAVSIVSKVDIEAQLKQDNTPVKDNTSVEVSLGKPPSDSAIVITPTKFTIGARVTLNGTVYKTSYGGGPGKSFTNHYVKIDLINNKGTHPYHVAEFGGTALGWVTENSLSLSPQLPKKTRPIRSVQPGPNDPKPIDLMGAERRMQLF